ncbi:MAG TPA: hypothetical protein PK293_09725 [Spirochaetota bacterium]|nr:hypothetical protein [Spirochaetota bacterium]HPF06301.1 hypothetical protein [Spirochaetota bacterium]HPJ41327.1 hypothetical protein [Spirochaetota bacterium]HPR37061.1 hypothetical protein [Spirochaetota bacterium]
MSYNNILIYFALYSFTGWIIELLYRSLNNRRLVNPGFLYGPFVPIYGIGGIFVSLLHQQFNTYPVPFQFFIFALILTAIEYLTGELFERFFQLKLWDYSDNRFNLNGKISLLFSTGWGLLALIVVYYIHPAVSYPVNKISSRESVIISGIILTYFITDAAYSTASLNRFRRDILYLYEKYSLLSNTEVQKIINSFRRILGAFPDLNEYLNAKINIKLKDKAENMINRLTENIETIMKDRKPAEHEYNAIVADILANEEFLKLRNYFHHNSSIYEHAKIVSYLAYRLCKYLNLDYRSAARGALLHDFFLYDWRNHDLPDLAKDKYHGIAHPKIALNNALRHFRLNDLEKDIIVKHMWPLTLIPPKYQESYIVTFTDKYVASKEFIDEFRRRKFKFRKSRSLN